MPFVETRLISPTTLTTSAASALYTVPTGYSAIIKQLVVTNITGTAATFTFYIGTASAGNALFSGTSVAANDTVVINLSQVLTTGETLRALASSNSALNLTVSGVINDGPLASTATVIVDNAVTTNKIAAGAVTTAKIADGAIVTVDIADGAVTQAKLSTDIPLSGMRNLIINGNMSVAQRGGAITTSNGYTLDRWHVNSGANATLTQSTDAAGATGNSLYSLKAVASGTQQIFVRQAIETLNAVYLAGKTVTLSAFAAGISSTTNLNMSLAWSTSSDNGVTGTWTAITPTSGGDLTLSATMTRFTGVFAVPSTAKSLRVQFVNNAANFTVNQGFYLGDVQLEAGPQATPFEQRPIGVELALCQRYYWRTIDSQALGLIMVGGVEGATAAAVGCTLPVTMRATPSMALGSGIRFFSSGSSTVTPTISWQRSSASFGSAALIISSGTVGQAGYLYNLPAANSYIEFSCEL